MQTRGVEGLGDGVVEAVDGVGGEDVGGVGVRVAEEVGEGDCGEGVVVGGGAFVEFGHGFCDVGGLLFWFVFCGGTCVKGDGRCGRLSCSCYVM